MYTMKEACERTGLSYETLKFYCNKGLVPNVKRDSQNRRVFDDRDIAAIQGLQCLRNCNMSIQQMKEYMDLCMQGQSTIPQRQTILEAQLILLEGEMARLRESIDYIHWKQGFYEDVLAGRTKYYSNLIDVEE